MNTKPILSISPCNSYHAVAIRRSLVRMSDGRSAFKMYFVSIIGRDKPERFEWDKSLRTPGWFEGVFKQSMLQGVGFVTAFPHISKVFRFGPANETILNVRAFSTPDFSDLSLARDDGFMEFACLAEALIAADEYRAWAAAACVEDYLQSWSAQADMPVLSNTKLAAHWEKQKS